MTIANAIRVLPESAQRLGQIARNVAASLPVSSLADSARHLTFVDGAGAWDETVLKAASEGAAGILLDCPGYLPSARIEAVAARLAGLHVSLVVRSVWASQATVASARQLFDEVEQPVLLDVVIHNDGTIAPATAAIAAIQMVEALAGRVNRLIVDSADSSGFAARGTVGEAKRALTVAAGPSCSGCSIEVRLLGMDRMARLAAAYAATWRPVQASIADANGERALPAHFESPDRSACAHLITLIESSVANLDDLHDFAAAAALIETTSLV